MAYSPSSQKGPAAAGEMDIDEPDPVDLPAELKTTRVEKTDSEKERQDECVKSMVRDACLLTLSCYYVEDIGKFRYLRSIWSDDRWCMRIQYILHRPIVRKFLTSLAAISMLSAQIEEPTSGHVMSWPREIGDAVFFVTHSIFLVVFVLTFICLWPTRAHWLFTDKKKRRELQMGKTEGSSTWDPVEPTEHKWMLTFGFGVVSSLIVRMMWMSTRGDHIGMRSVQTVYGEVTTGVDVTMRMFRCYYLLYFSYTMRYAFISALYLVNKLGSILGLICVCFLFFYFMIVTTLPILSKDSTDLEVRERNDYFATTEDGLFNLYVALTTANHPDIMMANYHANSWKMVPLIFFMIVVNMFLLNVFLGVVTKQYSTLVRGFVNASNDKAEALLRTAFHVMLYGRIAKSNSFKIDRDSPRDKQLISEIRSEMRTLEEENGIQKEQFMNAVESMVTYLKVLDSSNPFVAICNLEEGTTNKKDELWFCLMDVNIDRHINVQEFEKLHHVVRAPIVMMPAKDESAANFFLMNKLTTQSCYEFLSVCGLRTSADKGPEATRVSLERSKSDPVAAEEDPVFNFGFMKEVLIGLNYSYLMNSLIMTNVFLALFVYPRQNYQSQIDEDKCAKDEGVSEIFFTIVFSADVLISSTGCSSKQEPLKYFYSKVGVHSDHWYNWIDVSVVTVMWINLISKCANGSSSAALTSIAGLLRVCRVIRIVLHVETFKRMFNATSRVIPSIIPQLGLFAIAYYWFAIVGMSLFAGCVTEVTADNGPGFWDTEPYDENLFATGIYYVNLNFDDLYSSLVTLFMLMIQNNWHVTTAGYVECTGTKWARLYFFSFNVIVALLMINIFVGILIDMFAIYWQDEQAVRSHAVSEINSGFLKVLGQRMEVRGSDSQMKKWIEEEDSKGDPPVLADKWIINPKVTSEDVYAGPCDAARIAGELDMEEHKQGIRNIAFSMPFPVYCRTDTNKIAYCNKNFASLYGQNDVAVLIGSSTLNILLDKNEEKTPRDIKHNKEARKNQECIEYTEDGVLPDGREVVFVCHEQPIVFLPFKNTTVVFMNPTDGKGNTLKFHVDGWFNATKEEDYRLRTSSARKTEHVRLTSAYDEDATAAVPKPI